MRSGKPEKRISHAEFIHSSKLPAPIVEMSLAITGTLSSDGGIVSGHSLATTRYENGLVTEGSDNWESPGPLRRPNIELGAINVQRAERQRRNFVIGGCAYQMRVDGRVTAAIAELATISCGDRDDHILAKVQFMHTSNLPVGRCEWLREQIADKHLDLAISVDSDTYFDAPSLAAELWRVNGDIAIGFAPLRVGGQMLCNLNIRSDAAEDWGRRMNLDELMKLIEHGGNAEREIASGGFGLAIFNLRWFRGRWPRPEPEHVSMVTGEDIELCRSVKQRDGKIIALRVKTDHFAFGERQTR